MCLFQCLDPSFSVRRWCRRLFGLEVQRCIGDDVGNNRYKHCKPITSDGMVVICRFCRRHLNPSSTTWNSYSTATPYAAPPQMYMRPVTPTPGFAATPTPSFVPSVHSLAVPIYVSPGQPIAPMNPWLAAPMPNYQPAMQTLAVPNHTPTRSVSSRNSRHNGAAATTVPVKA